MHRKPSFVYLPGLILAGLSVSTLSCSTSPPAQSAKDAQQAPASPALPAIRADQHGYLPTAPKIAVWVSTATDGAPWELKNAAGKTVSSGTTSRQGGDAESGDTLHSIDFSDYQTPGADYTLQIGSETSHPFQIAADLYSSLFVDGGRYFYLNRSGVPLEMPYSGEARWARPAGHLSDSKVACFPDSGCDYSLDVSGGWYDAGDYGKYVVNGGLSAWLLLNAYEMAATNGHASFFADGQLNIPESGNGTSDLLDEARYEIEFLLRMQVPEGQPLAGLVHHKIHDEKWTAMGFRPTTQTEVTRYLHAPSTAAALNVAAVGAMAARLYQQADPAFAERCLKAAKAAFAAALAHPEVLAPAASHTGGGPYDDKQLSDDFYWAAAELFTTTGEASYGDVVHKSPHFVALSDRAGGYPVSFDWATTDVLGSMTLMLHPERINEEERSVLKKEIVRHAERDLSLIEKQGYHFPFEAGKGGYPWGSNSFVTDNAIVLAFAHQQTGEAKYLNGAYEAMHFILGRNANGFSYVSGYGESALINPHHRFWAHSVNPELPAPPPGALSGGPNSNPTDPPMKAQRKDCIFQKCYLDDLGAYSVNEVAINWNASLTWVAAYFAQQ